MKVQYDSGLIDVPTNKTVSRISTPPSIQTHGLNTWIENMETLYLAVLTCLLLLSPIYGDCPDAYWDCLITTEDGYIRATAGGFAYGKCMRWPSKFALAVAHT